MTVAVLIRPWGIRGELTAIPFSDHPERFENLGRVTGWEEGGSSGLLRVGEDLLIPFARSMCVAIDTAARRIEVELPEGLRDVNRS